MSQPISMVISYPCEFCRELKWSSLSCSHRSYWLWRSTLFTLWWVKPLLACSSLGLAVYCYLGFYSTRTRTGPEQTETAALRRVLAGQRFPWKIGQTEAIEWVQLVAKRQAFYISMESGQGGTTWGSTDEVDRIWAIRGSQSETDFRKKNTDGTGWDCVPDVEEAQTVWLPVGQKP